MCSSPGRAARRRWLVPVWPGEGGGEKERKEEEEGREKKKKERREGKGKEGNEREKRGEEKKLFGFWSGFKSRL